MPVLLEELVLLLRQQVLHGRRIDDRAREVLVRAVVLQVSCRFCVTDGLVS